MEESARRELNSQQQSQVLIEKLCSGDITLNDARKAAGLALVDDPEFDQQLALSRNLVSFELTLHGGDYNERIAGAVFQTSVPSIQKAVYDAMPVG
jgi:hypothetical protein